MRLNAYAELVAASHDFMQRFMEDLAGVQTSDSFSRALQDVAQKASIVELVGPEKVGSSAVALQRGAERLLAVTLDPNEMEGFQRSTPEEKNEFPPYREFVGLLDDLLAKGKSSIGTR